MISATKTINFCIKWFHMIMRVKIKCFFLHWKRLKNIFELENIFYFEFIVGFLVSLCFLRPWIGLTRFQRCFLGVLGKKKNRLQMVSRWRKQEPCCSGHLNSRNLRNYRWRVVCKEIRHIISFFFFVKEWANDIWQMTCHPPH